MIITLSGLQITTCNLNAFVLKLAYELYIILVNIHRKDIRQERIGCFIVLLYEY